MDEIREEYFGRRDAERAAARWGIENATFMLDIDEDGDDPYTLGFMKTIHKLQEVSA